MGNEPYEQSYYLTLSSFLHLGFGVSFAASFGSVCWLREVPLSGMANRSELACCSKFVDLIIKKIYLCCLRGLKIAWNLKLTFPCPKRIFPFENHRNLIMKPIIKFSFLFLLSMTHMYAKMIKCLIFLTKGSKMTRDVPFFGVPFFEQKIILGYRFR